MGYDHFRYARKIDADNIGIYHNDLTELLRLDKATANVMRMEGGLGVTADKLRVAANTIDAFPIIELWGNSKINLNAAANNDIQITVSGTGRLRYGTQNALAGETVTHYLDAKDTAGAAIKIALVS